MSKEPVYIAGVYEHPTRDAPEKSTLQLHAEVLDGALEDAGLETEAVDGYFSAGNTDFGFRQGPMELPEYLGLETAYVDVTDHGGSSYVSHVGHAAAAIRNDDCDVAAITLAGRPRQWDRSGSPVRRHAAAFESIYGTGTLNAYGMAMRRHTYEFGTTAEQLAEIKATASQHAQYNDDAFLSDPVSVEDVLESRAVADPLRLMDCCVVTDGGGLCNNHPSNRGGMTKVIEAVRQLRGETNEEVQVDADVALAHGTGGGLGMGRHQSATAILGSEDR